MTTGFARVALAALVFAALGGCAGGAPPAVLTAAELDAMIRVEVEPIGPAPAEDSVVAALQP